MMNWMRKCKGSISIFLCIILLPMVTYSTMIIDSSRLQTSRIAITNAGDLTMNAAMSEYEQILHDMYGLFAVSGSEDPDKLKTALRAYFQQTVENKILTVDSEGNFVSNFVDWLVDVGFNGGADPDEITNYLQMQVEDFTYEGVHGAELANPAVMKRQIVDYMKYKGPLSIASTLFKKLDFLKDSGNQTQVVSNKVKYTKALGDMQSPCEVIYSYLIAGDYSGDPNPFSGEAGAPFSYNEIMGDQAAIDSYSSIPGSTMKPINVQINDQHIDDRYEEAVQYYKFATYFYLLYENRAKFEDSDNWNFPSMSLSEIENLVNVSDRIDYSVKDRTIDERRTSTRKYWQIQDDYWRKANDIADVMNTIVDKDSGERGLFENLADDYTLARNYSNGNYPSVSHGNDVDGNRPVYNTIEYSNFRREYMRKDIPVPDGYTVSISDKKVDAERKFNAQYDYYNMKYQMIKLCYYHKVLDALQDAYINSLNGWYNNKLWHYERDDTSDDKTDAYRQLSDDYNDKYYGVYKPYEKCVDDIRTNYTDNIGAIITEARNNSFYTNHADYYISTIYLKYKDMYTLLKGAKVILEHVKSQLDIIEEKIEAAESAKATWQGSIGNVNSSSIRENMQSDYNSTIDSIDKNAFDTFKAFVVDQIGNDTNGVTGAIKKLEALTFNGTKIIEYHDNNESAFNFGDLAGKITSSTLDQATTIGDEYVENTSNPDESHFKPTDRTSIYFAKFEPIEGIETFPFDPANPDNSKEKFMETIISVATAEGKPMEDSTQQMMDQINSDNNVDSNGQPSGDSTADELGEKPKAASGDAGNAFEAAMTEIKDWYANDNDTTNDDETGLPSGGVKAVEEPDDADIEDDNPSESLDNASNSDGTGILDMLSNLGATIVNSAYLEEYFTEMFTCQTDAIYVDEANGTTKYDGFNKNLLNPANNWYGKEVEYILWGHETLSENLAANEALIFLIRFALNAIYAFTATDIQSFALEVATAIAGWTVVGVPIVQALITLGIALAESAYDLHLLKDGEDVPIYKNAKTFVCSPTGALTTIVEHELTNTVNAVIDSATSKIEQAMDDLVDKAVNGAYDKIGNMIDDASSGLNATINDMASQFSETIRTAADNMFINPIVNELNPIWAEVNNGSTELHAAVVAHINDAFTEIENSVANLNEGELKTLISSAMSNSTVYGQLKDDIITTIETYFTDFDEASNTFNPNNIRNSISGPNGAIDKFITQQGAKLTELKDGAVSKIKNTLEEHRDESATNIKSYLHDGMDSLSESATSTVNSTIQSSVDAFNNARKPSDDGFSKKNPLEDATDAGVESGGFTLNYKEYCKIFVLIHIAANEDIMLQRAAAIMQTNVCAGDKDGRKNENFHMNSADTMVSVNAKVKLGTLFPWVAQDSLDDASIDPDISVDTSHIGSNFVNIDYNGVTGY